MDANLYHPDFQPGTPVKVVNYNPNGFVSDSDPNPNGHTGTVEAFEDDLGALSAAILGLVRVNIPDLSAGNDDGTDWWALTPKELEVTR